MISLQNLPDAVCLPDRIVCVPVGDFLNVFACYKGICWHEMNSLVWYETMIRWSRWHLGRGNGYLSVVRVHTFFAFAVNGSNRVEVGVPALNTTICVVGRANRS